MKLFNFFTIACLLTSLLGCNRSQSPEASSSDDVDILKDCPVVARYQVIGGDSVLVCDAKAVKEEIEAPLSSLLNSYEVIALDTCREALCSPGGTATVSSRYLVINGDEEPLRLFERRTGKYLRQIGKRGEGPREYPDALGVQIEEDSDIVFVSARHPNRILQYKLSTGDFEKEYRLLYRIGSHFHCNLEEREITVMRSPYPPYTEGECFFWKQTFEGELIHGISGIEQMGLSPRNRGNGYLDDRSNCFYVSLWDTTLVKPDTLYRYDTKENRLIPQFVTEWGEKIPLHSYMEFPDYYYCETIDKDKTHLLIHKHTGKGAKIKVGLDMFGKELELEELSVHSYNSSYFTFLFDPLQLADVLQQEEQQKTLAGKTMHPDSLQNENSWVFIGKWR